MEIVGYLLFIFMGLTLGVIGAGGAILAIPILLYIFKIPILLATTYSLFIVGFTAFFAMLRYRAYIDFKNAAIFVLPSLIGVFIARFYLLPILPAEIFGFSRDALLINLLVTFMFLAAYFMITQKNYEQTVKDLYLRTYLKIISISSLLGIIMGIIGVGGGFLIIPVLVLILGVGMRKAIPTSLLIITANSAVGFISDRQYIGRDTYKDLIIFVLLAMLGMLVGTTIGPKLSSDKLKITFGWFVVSLAVFILLKESF